MKEKQLEILFNKMSTCQKCLHLKKKNNQDCSLINIYQNNFYKEIPSIWTDWLNRTNSKIMIIGQDWGPYKEMQQFRNLYLKTPTSKNWSKIIEEEKSLTKRMLTKYLIESANEYNINIDATFLNTIYITNAIMCARQGTSYRSNNIKLKESTLNCQTYLKEQIDIINPKIILTLGYYPLLSLSKIFNFEIYDQVSKNINELGIFQIEDKIIIPLYHPAAQISTELQLNQYRKIWRYYE